MTANPTTNPIDPLDLYLDGMLEGEALAAFERRLAADADLRRIVENHRKIESGLKRTYKAPSIRVSLTAADVPAPIPISTGDPSANRSFKFPIAPRFLLYAAVIAVAAAAGWWQMRPPGSSIQTPRLTGGSVFATLTSKGFKPEEVCTTDEAFNGYMTKRFGQGLLIASAPNIELIGWAYSDGYKGAVISTREVILMAKVDGKESLVFMDKKISEPKGWFGQSKVQMDPPEGMHVFRREIGEYVLYELTASPKGVLTDRAYIPDATPKPE